MSTGGGAGRVYPFGERKLRWFLRDRYRHLLAALERDPPALHGEEQDILRRRVKSLGHWSRVRGMVMVLLSMGVIATVVAGVAQYADGVQGFAQLQALVQVIAQVAGASTAALTVVALVLTRLLSQIEGDILMLLRKETHKHQNA